MLNRQWGGPGPCHRAWDRGGARWPYLGGVAAAARSAPVGADRRGRAVRGGAVLHAAGRLDCARRGLLVGAGASLARASRALRKIVRFLTPEHMCIVLLAINTGMRRGERSTLPVMPVVMPQYPPRVGHLLRERDGEPEALYD